MLQSSRLASAVQGTITRQAMSSSIMSSSMQPSKHQWSKSSSAFQKLTKGFLNMSHPSSTSVRSLHQMSKAEELTSLQSRFLDPNTSFAEQKQIDHQLNEFWKGATETEIIELADDASTEHYANVLGIVVKSSDGIRLKSVSGKEYFCLNMAYGAARPGYNRREILDKVIEVMGRLGVIPSRAVYTREYAQAVAFTRDLFRPHIHQASAQDHAKVLTLNTGGEIMDSVQQGFKRYFASAGKQTAVIIFTNHFHGRRDFANDWNYEVIYNGKDEIQVDDKGRVYLPFNEPEMLYRAVNTLAALDYGVGIMVEPVQGEGGVNPMSPQMVSTLNRIQSEHSNKAQAAESVLICADEVQSYGCVKEGLASARLGLKPDMVALSKLATCGIIAAAPLVTRQSIAQKAFPPGSDGGTFSGNPAAMVAMYHSLKWQHTKDEQGVTPLERLENKGDAVRRILEAACESNPAHLGEVKGLGSMLGLEFKSQADADHYHDLFLDLKEVVGSKGLTQALAQRLEAKGLSRDYVQTIAGIVQKLSGQEGNVMRVTVGDGSEADGKALREMMSFALTHEALNPPPNQDR